MPYVDSRGQIILTSDEVASNTPEALKRILGMHRSEDYGNGGLPNEVLIESGVSNCGPTSMLDGVSEAHLEELRSLLSKDS